jgi:hypothetical protein
VGALGYTVVALIRGDDSSNDATVAVSPSSSTMMAIPPIGKVRDAQLSDGSPVWIVRHNDGTVSTVSAVSTHAPYGLRQLVGWCASGRNFEDGMYGSTYDERGTRIGGPAPRSLPIADTHRKARDRVRVGSLHAAPEVNSNAIGAGIKTCYANTATGFDAGTTRLPDYFKSNPTTIEAIAREARQGSSTGVGYLRGAALVVAPDNSTRLCAATSKTIPVCTEGPLVDGIDGAGLRTQYPGAYLVIDGDMLLRPERGSIELVAFTNGYTISAGSPST